MLASCHTTLGDDSYDMAWAEGYALVDDRRGRVRPKGPRRTQAPRGRVGEPDAHRAGGRRADRGRPLQPEIAAKLIMSRDTVKTHLSHIFTKLGVTSRSELAVAAARRRT